MTELKVVLRRLRTRPAFAVACVLTLALGIGVNVAIFSLVHGVLLKPLPYPEPERLVVVSHAAPRLHLDDLNISPPLYLRYREQSTSFVEMGLVLDERVSLTGLEAPERVRQGRVSSSVFRVFGVSPILGRSFLAEDERPGAPPVALISERLWRGRLGGDSQALGRRIEIDGSERAIVGVLPAYFEVPHNETEVWVPFIADPRMDHLGSFGYVCIARLKAGVSRAAATSDLKRFTDDLKEQFPEERAAPVLARSGFTPVIVPLLDELVGNVRRAMWIVFGAVGLVLLMACANVANLFLVRAEARQRELALRRALGASPARIVASFLKEGLLLAGAGGGLGVLLAHGAIGMVLRSAPEGIARLHHVGIDGAALLFALGVSLFSAMLFSVLPAIPYGNPNVALALRESGRAAGAGRSRVRARQALVVAQIALSLMLLVGAVLMVRSFRRLLEVEPGFEARQALTLRLSLPGARFDSPERLADFADRLTERLQALPGVSAVGAVSNLPLSGLAKGAGHTLQDFPLDDDDLPPVFTRAFASPGYLDAMGIALVDGRWFEPADHQQKTGVAVVSRSLARRYWPASGPMGRRLRPRGAREDRWYTIVGVVGDVRHVRLQDEPGETVYYPMVGLEGDDALESNVSFVLRTRAAPESLGPAVRKAVWELDPNVPITHVLTLEQMVVGSRAPMAFNMLLLMAASALALLLGGIGVYGVISFVVTQRTAEIGVRMALGAARGQVRGMVLGDGLKLAVPGIAIGLATSLAATRLMKSLLFGVSPLDPVTFLIVPAFLFALALASSFIPAERASRLDPARALRQE